MNSWGSEAANVGGVTLTLNFVLLLLICFFPRVRDDVEVDEDGIDNENFNSDRIHSSSSLAGGSNFLFLLFLSAMCCLFSSPCTIPNDDDDGSEVDEDDITKNI